MKQNSIFYLI